MQKLNDFLPAPLQKTITPSEQPETPLTTPKLTCTISSGSTNFNGSWYDIEPKTIGIHQLEEKQFNLKCKRKDQYTSLYMRFENSGQRLVICPLTDTLNPNEKVICESLYALEDDFLQGIERTLDVPKTIRGGKIKCKYLEGI